MIFPFCFPWSGAGVVWVCGVNAMRCFGRVMLGAMLLAGSSCERVRKAVEEAKEKAGETAGEGASREELGKLVDRTEDGYRFRHDLAFPERVRCQMESRMTFTKGRTFIKTAFGGGSAPFEGVMDNMLVLERDGAVVSLEIKRSRTGPASTESETTSAESEKEGEKGQENELSGDVAGEETDVPEDSVEGMKLRFIHREDGWHWSGKGGDFREMAAGKQIEQAVDESLGLWGLIPRSPWFGERRFSPGTEVKLVGKQIALITGTRVNRGKATLRFEKTETLDGHPCGVFAWSGDYEEEVPNLTGERQEAEVSVSEGRVWCSLIYPVVLRNEGKGMVTMIVRNSKGKLKQRIQGAVESSQSWQWNPLAKEGGGG